MDEYDKATLAYPRDSEKLFLIIIWLILNCHRSFSCILFNENKERDYRQKKSREQKVVMGKEERIKETT